MKTPPTEKVFSSKYFEKHYADDEDSVAYDNELEIHAARVFATAASLLSFSAMRVVELGAGRPSRTMPGESIWSAGVTQLCTKMQWPRPWWMCSDTHRNEVRPAAWPAFSLGIDDRIPTLLTHPRSDLVVCADVLGYVKNLRMAAHQLARIGKPQCVLYVTTPLDTDRAAMDPKRSDMDQLYHSRAQLDAALGEQGFVEMGLGFWHRGKPPDGAWSLDLRRNAR